MSNQLKMVMTMHAEHVQRAEILGEMYRNDATLDTDKKNPKFSMDMQKIMMLPHLPGIKTALFTWRIIMINESMRVIKPFMNHFFNYFVKNR